MFNKYKRELQDLVKSAWMALSTTKIRVIEKEIKGIHLPQEVAILDIETTGLEPDTCEMVSYGVIKANKAKVVIRITAEETDLLNSLRNDLDDINVIYAFYSPFEEKWLRYKLGDLDVEFRDLKRMSGRLKDIIPFDWGDYTDGEQVPRLWQNWCERLSFGSFSAIIHHNYADLVREPILFVVLWNEGFDGASITEDEWISEGEGDANDATN